MPELRSKSRRFHACYAVQVLPILSSGRPTMIIFTLLLIRALAWAIGNVGRLTFIPGMLHDTHN